MLCCILNWVIEFLELRCSCIVRWAAAWRCRLPSRLDNAQASLALCSLLRQFKEKVYQDAFEVLLKENKIPYEREKHINLVYHSVTCMWVITRGGCCWTDAKPSVMPSSLEHYRGAKEEGVANFGTTSLEYKWYPNEWHHRQCASINWSFPLSRLGIVQIHLSSALAAPSVGWKFSNSQLFDWGMSRERCAKREKSKLACFSEPKQPQRS